MALTLHNLSQFYKINSFLRLKQTLSGGSKLGTIYVEQKNYKSNLAEEKKDCFSQFRPLSETRFTKVTHVIFDLDGVFVDTAKFYHAAHSNYLGKFKKRYTPKAKAIATGILDVDAAKYIIREFDLPMTPEVYAHGIWQDLRQNLSKAKLIEGVKNLICHLYENNIPMALASSNNTKSFNLKVKNHQLMLQYFCHIVLGDDPAVKRGKPAPDIFEVTAKRFYNKPSVATNVLVIEDSIKGVEAAKSAGFQTIILPEKSIPKSLIKDADLIVDKLNEINLADFDMPKIPPGINY